MATTSNYCLKGKALDSCMELVRAFPLSSIQSDDHLAKARRVMDRLLAKGELDDGEETYLDALSDLAAVYVDEYHSIPPASDADMLRHLLEAKGIAPSRLSQEAGIAESSISEVLAGKKPFRGQMIRRLAEYFQVDVSILAGNLRRRRRAKPRAMARRRRSRSTPTFHSDAARSDRHCGE